MATTFEIEAEPLTAEAFAPYGQKSRGDLCV